MHTVERKSPFRCRVFPSTLRLSVKLASDMQSRVGTMAKHSAKEQLP